MKALILWLALLLPLNAFATPIYCIDEDAKWHTMESDGKNVVLDGTRFFYDKEYEVNKKRMSLYHADSGEKLRMILILQDKEADVYIDFYTENETLVYTAHCAI